jgi:hypothetical protein
VRAAEPRHLIRAYRDLELLDRDGEMCGIVDDIEMAQHDPGVWEMTALLVGPGAWGRRAPRWLTALLPGQKIVRIDAADVASTGSAVRLMKRADELGLARVEHRLLRRFGSH